LDIPSGDRLSNLLIHQLFKGDAIPFAGRNQIKIGGPPRFQARRYIGKAGLNGQGTWMISPEPFQFSFLFQIQARMG
jgi:hypothetical protein